MSVDIEQANQTAVERMTSARPMLTGVAVARDVIPGLGEGKLLHAGPPIEWPRMSGPLQGAIIGAILLEGWARDEAAARRLAQSGEIAFEPCHHHGAVGPMAGVTSPSMAVYVVENTTHGNRAFSNLNEGYGKVLRYGAFAPEVLDKLRWMNGDMAEVLAAALEACGSVDLKTLLAEALHMKRCNLEFTQPQCSQQTGGCRLQF
ncbi:MAG: DUF1116 domain-containing protein [Acidobacteriota bacterium]